MKHILFASVLGCLASAPAFGAAPNLFSCTNANHDISVRYTTTSIDGKPHLSLAVSGQNAMTFIGGEGRYSLQSSATPLGALVSAIVLPARFHEAPARFYSLVIPEINLGTARRIAFNTVMLEGVMNRHRMPPAAAQRIIATHTLTCQAERVWF